MREGDKDSKKGKRLEEEKKRSRSARKMSMRREMKQNEHR